ncbi:hypothetical protein ACIROD_21025 [Peribacillus sp. NPDC101481]|uniref:hypothetical protein n=1 Tax=unclassified Peribacillus TaxID=2675266 RepID=UPI0038019F25
MLYLAGDISRKIGNEKAAIKYFSLVFEGQNNDRVASIIQMAGPLSGTQAAANTPLSCCSTDIKKAVH